MVPSIARATNLLRGLYVIFCLCVGSAIGEALMGDPLLGAALGTVFGLCTVLVDRLLKGVTLRAFSSATAGLLLGMIAARLLRGSNVLQYLGEDLQWTIELIVYVVFGYFGMMLAIRSNRDEFALIIPYVRFRRHGVEELPVLLDTSAVIDGRVRGLCQSGFLGGTLVVPSFVLEELQVLADSPDPLRHDKGRRGFEILSELQMATGLEVNVHQTEPEPGLPADTRLVQTAKLLGARLLTGDAALCAHARLQGVSVLNLAELSEAVRPLLRPGDRIDLTLVKEGREAHQAVGYLEDGTMIVVNRARPDIGQTVPVSISGSVRTAAGKLYFAEKLAA